MWAGPGSDPKKTPSVHRQVFCSREQLRNVEKTQSNLSSQMEDAETVDTHQRATVVNAEEG